MLEKQGIEEIQNQKDLDFADRVRKKYEEKPMIRVLRNRTRNCRFITIPFQIVSFISIVGFIVWVSSNYSGVVFWSVVLLLSLLGVAWEWGKRKTIIHSFDALWNPSRRVKIWLSPLALLLIIGSFFGSFKGGDETMKAQIAPPLLVHNAKIDSIQAKIEEGNSILVSLQKTTWKGKVTRTANKGINTTQALQLEREKQIAQLQQEDKLANNEILNNHEAKKVSFGLVCGAIAGFMDILLLIFLAFAEHFETEADKLLKRMQTTEIDNSNTPASTTSSYQQIPGASQQAAPRPISENKKKIGFEIPENGFVSTQKQVTQANTQKHTGETQNAETRVPRETQPDTVLTRPQKDPDYVVKMIKRVRQRWARSFEQHPQAPKSPNTRKTLRENALEEWKELEDLGYKVAKDTKINPWGLEVVSPQKRA